MAKRTTGHADLKETLDALKLAHTARVTLSLDGQALLIERIERALEEHDRMNRAIRQRIARIETMIRERIDIEEDSDFDDDV